MLVWGYHFTRSKHKIVWRFCCKLSLRFPRDMFKNNNTRRTLIKRLKPTMPRIHQHHNYNHSTYFIHFNDVCWCGPLEYTSIFQEVCKVWSWNFYSPNWVFTWRVLYWVLFVVYTPLSPLNIKSWTQGFGTVHQTIHPKPKWCVPTRKTHVSQLLPKLLVPRRSFGSSKPQGRVLAKKSRSFESMHFPRSMDQNYPLIDFMVFM